VNLFGLAGAFQAVPGTAPIVVAAPHHGSRPNVDADRGTGPIALALAVELGASAVVVHDLRRTVDVNKDPAQLPASVRGYALRYQNELFRDSPRLVIEIHGHVTGRYEVEVTTGFELRADWTADVCLAAKLAVLQYTLPGTLAAHIGRRPSVGVYPLDRDVTNTAKATFTFQKIRRARSLAGVECYGLHIELGQRLRPGQLASSPALARAVAKGLAAAIGPAFDPLPVVMAAPDHTHPTDSSAALLSSRVLQVRSALPGSRDDFLTVHPADLETLGALDGDTVLLCHDADELVMTITPSQAVPAGLALVPAAVCRQFGLGKRSQVIVGRPAPNGSVPTAQPVDAALVVQARPGRSRQVWLGPADIERMGLLAGAHIATKSPAIPQPINSTVLRADPALPPCSAALSTALMGRLGLTLGEVIIIQEER
jgi:hypothetical protein